MADAQMPRRPAVRHAERPGDPCPDSDSNSARFDDTDRLRRSPRWPRVTFAVLCGLTAAFVWLVVTRVIHA